MNDPQLLKRFSKLWYDTSDQVHLLSLRQVLDVLSQPLLNLQTHLNVVVLVVGLVKFVSSNAVEVLAHVAFFVFGNSAVESSVVERPTFLQNDPKYLFFTFV